MGNTLLNGLKSDAITISMHIMVLFICKFFGNAIDATLFLEYSRLCRRRYAGTFQKVLNPFCVWLIDAV